MPHRRRTAIGLVYAGLPFGGALASLISYFGHDLSDWRTIFYIGGILPVLELIPLAIFLPRLLAPARREADAGFIRALFGEGRAVTSLLLWAAFFLPCWSCICC